MIKHLDENNTKLIKNIDRTEDINSSYRIELGKLVKYHHEPIVGGWEPNELEDIVERSSTLIRQRGVVLGYFNEDDIIGVASVGSQKLSAPSNYVLMDILYISDKFRGKGIGNRLFEAIKAEAMKLGANGIYISARPSAGTVEFYLSRGCELATPNEYYFRKEPEDIHLQYNF